MTHVTESKKTKQITEHYFKIFFEQSDTLCMILDPNTSDGIPIIIDVNDAACKAHGYTKEELIGRPVAEINDEEGKRMVRDRTQQMLSGTPLKIENTHVRKDGTTFSVAVYANRVDIEGEPPLIFTTEHDITERKQMEEELYLNHRMLIEAERLANLGSWIFDMVKDSFVLSEQWQKNHGVKKSSLSSDELLPIAHPDDIETIKNAFVTSINEGKPYDITHRIIRQDDGEERIVQAYGEIIMRDEHGNPIKMYGFAQDITERKQAELERESMIKKLEVAISEIKTLKGIIPICSYCKVIRNDEGAWERLEAYITHHSDAQFSHGICPECVSKVRADPNYSG